MEPAIETIIKKVAKRAIDLFINENVILNIDNEPFDNKYLSSKFGVFIEIADQEETITALGNIENNITILDNIIFVLINVIKTLDTEYLEKLKNNQLTIRIWIVESYINLKGQTEREKVYGISVNKPAILINKNDTNTYCYLPSIWKDQSDAIYILENLAINANLEKDDWKNNDLDLITFKPTLITIN